MVNLQRIAYQGREYCQEKQGRNYPLEGACHENVIDLADYIRLQTDYNPLIVWGEVSHRPEEESPNNFENAKESTTHFWCELESKDGIIDVYTNNPLVGDNSEYVENGIAYGGKKPDCYNTIEKFRYFGQLEYHHLNNKESLSSSLPFIAAERYDGESISIRS